MRKNRVWSLLALAMIPVTLGVIGCKNNNLFTSLHGDSSDPRTLAAEAAIALREGKYSEALDKYNRVLGQDPYNAEALYGAASAAIGSSGLNFGTLISNVLKQVNGSSLSTVAGLGDLVTQGREHLSIKVNCGGLNSILDGIDCDALIAVLPTALNHLQYIVSGVSDGSMSRNDATLLIDLGVLRVLYAALLAERANFIHITNTGGDFSATAGTAVANACDPGANAQTTETIIRQVAYSYALFNRVVTLLNLTGSPIVIQIRNDVKVAGDAIMAQGGSQILPAACFNPGGPFDTLGITQANYLSVLESGAFTAPS